MRADAWARAGRDPAVRLPPIPKPASRLKRALGVLSERLAPKPVLPPHIAEFVRETRARRVAELAKTIQITLLPKDLRAIQGRPGRPGDNPEARAAYKRLLEVEAATGTWMIRLYCVLGVVVVTLLISCLFAA